MLNMHIFQNLHAEDITKHMYMYLLKMLNVNFPSE